MRNGIKVFCVLLFLAIGCRNKAPIVKEDNIDSIKITKNLSDTVVVKNVTDLKKIHQIITELNNADAELRYFKPSLVLTIIYNNKQKMRVLCTGKYIKINGLSYVIDEPIEDVIN